MKESTLRPAPARMLADFYREEFVKHQRCLEEQREYYSNGAISEVEAALTRIISQLDHLSGKENADKVVSGLLRKFNVVTGLSRWALAVMVGGGLANIAEALLTGGVTDFLPLRLGPSTITFSAGDVAVLVASVASFVALLQRRAAARLSFDRR